MATSQFEDVNVCICSNGNVDLIEGKVYWVTDDICGMVRVIDESGEDYLYPANVFKFESGEKRNVDKK